MPRSLFTQSSFMGDLASEVSAAQEAARYYSREASEAMYQRILGLITGGGELSVSIDTFWTGNLRWARNNVTTAGDTTNHQVRITRVIRGAQASSATNKFDDAALKLAVQSAERTLLYYPENPDNAPLPGKQEYYQPKLWSDASYNLDAAKRSSTAFELVQPSVQAKLLAAGYLQVGARTRSVFNTSGMDAYYAATVSQYSVTIRNPGGTGSGWAGVDKQDWAQIDATGISARALEKCVTSADPKAIEPGRYTLIMEPQAVHNLMIHAIYALDRYAAENFQTVYTLSPGQSKIGLQVFDERITISTNPMDPECGYIPFDWEGYPYRPVTWVDKGVLKELAYTRRYALSQLGSGIPLPNPYSYRIKGGETSIEEMIASTKRGLIVTRLTNIHVIDQSSLMSTGITRDGLWLIENGKITFPVKNFRFSESPMFAFNNVEQIGPAERVLASYPTIVPPMKVRDFNFTSLSDAV